MSAEVEWVLDQLASVVAAQPTDHPLKRVDRDTSQVYEGSDSVDMETPIHKRTAELKTANFVGARLADRSRSPIGTEYDYKVETAVGVRIEGLHESEWGHVDPAGSNGVVWSTFVDDIQNAIDASATFPNVTDATGEYTHLLLTNDAPDAASYKDYFRYDFDVVFSGFEQR